MVATSIIKNDHYKITFSIGVRPQLNLLSSERVKQVPKELQFKKIIK
jgi:hypothetical protein